MDTHKEERAALVHAALASRLDARVVAQGLFGALADAGCLRVAVLDLSSLDLLASSLSTWDELSEEELAVAELAQRSGGARCKARQAGAYWRVTMDERTLTLALWPEPQPRPSPREVAR